MIRWNPWFRCEAPWRLSGSFHQPGDRSRWRGAQGGEQRRVALDEHHAAAVDLPVGEEQQRDGGAAGQG